MKNSKELKERVEAANTAARDYAKENIEGVENPSQDVLDEYERLLDEYDSAKKDLEAAEKREALLKRSANFLGAKPKGEDSEWRSMSKNYSFQRVASSAMAGGVGLDGLEREMDQEGKLELARLGKSAEGIVIPHRILHAPVERATITENGTSGIVAKSFVDQVYEGSELMKLGITTMSSKEDVRVPLIGTITTEWEGETDTAADGGSALTKVDLTPKRLATFVEYSKQSAMQHNDSLEARLRKGIANSIAQKLEYATFTDDTSAGGFAHAGAGKTPVSGATVNALALGLIEQVLTNKFGKKSTHSFMMTTDLFAEVYQAVLATGVSALVAQEKILGHNFFFSSQVDTVTISSAAEPAVYYGDWSYWNMCQFGGIEVLFDPYTGAKNAKNILHLNSYWDAAFSRSAAVSVGGYTG